MTIALALIALLAVTSLAWRLSSRRHVLPCPSWLRWMVELDNPFAASNKAAFCLLYTSPSPRDQRGSRMPSSA